MKRILIALILLIVVSCKEEPQKTITVQEIVDNSITDSGGKLYGTHKVIFDFRDKKYVSENIEGVRVYQHKK